MRPRLHVRCLGEPLLLDHLRRPIRLRVRKHVALVFFLVLEPRHKATRERLRRLLWPEGNSAQSLSQAVVEIRRGLGTEIFETTDHHLALRPDVDITTDLQMLHTGAGELMIRELSQSFWSHVLFDGYEFEDADEWNSWLALERERWRDRLGRLAVDVSRTGEWARDSADRLRLRLWGTYLLGEVTPRTIARAEAGRPRWDHVDLRVFDVDRLLPLRPPTVLAVTGANQPDALAVVLAAVRQREGHVVAGMLDGTLAPATALAITLLALPGWVAAGPDAVARVQRLADGEPLTEETLGALREVLDTVREESAVVLIAPRGAAALVALVASVHTPAHTLRGLWLVALEPDGDLPPGAAHLAVEPAAMDRLLEVAGRLADSDVSEVGLQEALRRSHGSLALLAVLLRGAARTTAQGVTLSVALPSGPARAALLQHCTDLPAELSAALAAWADRAVPPATRGWGAPNGARRSAADRPTLVDGLPQALIWEDPSALLARLEDAVDRGDASGRSVNAALLVTRNRLGIANPSVVTDAVEARCQQLLANGEYLEPVEAIAYALIMSHAHARGSVSESTLHLIATAPKGQAPVGHAGHAIAGLIIAQQFRDRAGESVALEEIDRIAQARPDEAVFLEWIKSYARANNCLIRGRYLEARTVTAELANSAHSVGNIGAFRLALGHQLVATFRLGRYSEALAIAAAFGITELQSKARVNGIHALLVAQAAVSHGNLAKHRVLRDAIEEYFVCSTSPRGLLLGAEFLTSIGSHKRARLVSELALNQSNAAPLEEQQGLWMKWASRALPLNELDDHIEKLVKAKHKVDARDQLIVHIASKERGLRATSLLEEHRFHMHPLSPSATV